MDATKQAPADKGRGQAALFLSHLARDTDSFTFQTFPEDEQAKPAQHPRVLHGSHAQHQPTLEKLNAAGHGVFVMVNEGDGKGRKKQNVQRVRALFVDMDEGGPDALKKLLQAAIAAGTPPHIVTQSSPGKFHVYWRVVDCPLERFSGVQKNLAARLGGDASVIDLPRVMRLPGYQHRKGEPQPVRLMHASESEPYAVEDLAEALGLEEANGQRTGNGQSVLREWSTTQTQGIPVNIEDMLAVLSADDYQDWIETGMALHQADPDAGFAIWDRWSHKSDKYAPGQIQGKWASFGGRVEAPVTLATIHRRAVEHGWQPSEAGKRILPYHDDGKCADRYLDEYYTKQGVCRLVRMRGEWLQYNGAAYTPPDDEERIKSKLWAFLEHSLTTAKKAGDPPQPFPTTRRKVDDIMDALKHRPQVAISQIDRGWLIGPDKDADPPANEIVPCRNGLLHVPTGKLLAPTPRFFTRNALAFDYNPAAAKPMRWLKFLQELFRSQPEMIDLVQEMMGYLLTPDTSQQKIFLIVGPPAAGKSILCGVIEHLVGRANVAKASMSTLSQNKGAECLIGKTVAIVPDAHAGAQVDRTAVTELMKQISGGDNPALPRLYRSAYQGPVSVRFVVVANEAPPFADNSESMRRRIVGIPLQESFEGKEDTRLSEALRQEVPGILNWALEGNRRLNERSRFDPPPASRELSNNVGHDASPLGWFIADYCEAGEGKQVEVAQLYQAYRQACECDGHRACSKAVFGKRLKTALPKLYTTKPVNQSGHRQPTYIGVSPKRKAQL